MQQRYPDIHDIVSDKALYHYTQALKNRFMRNAPLISKVIWDNKIKVMKHALGLHTVVSRVQGGNLKANLELFPPRACAVSAHDCGARAGASEREGA